MALDRNGFSSFKLGNKDNVGDYSIDDGSNATYEVSGKGTDKFFKFSSFDESMEGENNVDYTILIQEGQILNMDNSSLKPIGKPNTSERRTFCNFGTQNIMRSLQSTGINNVLITGKANSMYNKLIESNDYKEVNFNDAIQNAKNGGLSLYSYKNPVPTKSGHVGTFSTGNNFNLGETANIGSKNGFMKYSEVFKSTANVKFFIFPLIK